MSAVREEAGVLGRYLVEAEIGRGAMGIVYKARHHLTQNRVALKVLDHAVLMHDAGVERFMREVSAAAKINHEGVVKVFDAGQLPDGRLFLAMELLEGQSVEDRFQRRGMTRLNALELIVQALEPLAAAHAMGIVHRDLKPENMFVVRMADGREVVKLLDFGIARDVAGKSVTATGMAVGTPYYMSPEQATRPSKAGPEADVWSVGVMIYELLCGIVPFDGESVHAVIVDACMKPHRPLMQASPDVPAPLADLVDRCLQKGPENRPHDARDLALQLNALLADPAIRRAIEIPLTRGSHPGRYSASGLRSKGAGTGPLPVDVIGPPAVPEGSLGPTLQRAGGSAPRILSATPPQSIVGVPARDSTMLADSGGSGPALPVQLPQTGGTKQGLGSQAAAPAASPAWAPSRSPGASPGFADRGSTVAISGPVPAAPVAAPIAPPPAPRRAPIVAIAIVGALLVVAGGVGVTYLALSGEEPPVVTTPPAAAPAAPTETVATPAPAAVEPPAPAEDPATAPTEDPAVATAEDPPAEEVRDTRRRERPTRREREAAAEETPPPAPAPAPVATAPPAPAPAPTPAPAPPVATAPAPSPPAATAPPRPTRPRETPTPAPTKQPPRERRQDPGFVTF